MALVTLIETTPLLAAGTSTVTVRLAGGGSPGKPYTGYRAADDWRSGLITRPRFSSALAFSQDGFSGGAVPQTSAITFSSADQSFMDTIQGYFWKGAKFTMWTGDDTFSPIVWTVRMSGTVADAGIEGNVLTLTVSDATEDLNVPVAPDQFAGSGGVEGDAEVKGRVKRRNIGRVFNVEGRVLVKASNIYEFGDLARPSQAFDALRDKGANAVTMIAVAWAGSVAATLNALIAAVPDQGGGAVAPSIQCVKWWTTPSGPLTADIRGENSGGYIERAADIANKLVTGATANITLTNVAATNTARPAACGLHFDSNSETVAEALDRLLLPLTLAWVLAADSTMTLNEWKWTGPVETIAADTVARETVFYPLRSVRLGYKRNNRIHTDAEIASGLDDSVATILAQLAIIQSDGWLSAGEKPVVIREMAAINDRATYLVNVANSLAVSSTAYTAARTALNNYLAGLVPAWNDTSTNTPIVAANFDAAFKTYYLRESALQAAIDDQIKATADGKITTFRQGTAPTAQGVGDLWIQTTANNKVWRWSGVAWVDARDGEIAIAQASAASAQSTADIKITTFFTTSTPTAITVGDLWYNATTKLLKRWNGSTWADAGSLGADWLSTLTNIPTAIADGRVDLGLNPDGTAKANRVTTGAIVVGTVQTRGSNQLGSDTPANGSYQTLCSLNLNLLAGDTVFCTALGACNYYGGVPDAEFRAALNGGILGMGTAVGAGSYLPAGVAGFNYTVPTNGLYNFSILFRGGSSQVHLTDAIIMVDVSRRNN